MARPQSQQLPQRPPAEPRAQTSDGARERSPSPHTEWQGRILEDLAVNSRRGGGLPVPHYKRELEPFSSHTFDASSTDCSDGKAPQEDSMALESKKSNAREAPSSLGTWLPDVSEVISRLRAGAEGFSSTEMERIQSAFQRFKDPDNPEIHKDELPKVLMHLGYTQISEDHVKELADSITKFPNMEKGEFIYFMEKHVEYEFDAFKEIFERFDEDGNGTLDADELCVFLSSLGFTPLRSIIRESLDLVDLDGNGVLDFEETVILMHVYRHSEGFTIDELQELTTVFMEQQSAAQTNAKSADERLLPADRLYHLLLQFFGPRAADFSQDLQQELSSAGRRRSVMAAQGAAAQVASGPAALTFQEAVLWARRFREKMFMNYREVFNKYDDDNSNSIDMSEVRNVIKDLGFTIPQKTVDELVYEARVRGDIVNRTEDTNLDYDSFVHFMQILNENDGFNAEEITRIQKTFHKFDLDGSGDISSIELSDMLRELGQCSRMEEVRSLLSAVDINGNGVLDMREFIRFMRLFREKQLARVKMVFTKQADPQVDPPAIPAAQVEEAVHAVLSEEAVEIALADGQSIAKEPLEFEDFVRIADELREYCVLTSKKFAGYSQMEVAGLRQVFDGFDHKKTGLLRQTEATELLKSLGIEVRSVEERLLLSEQIARACDAAREAGAQEVVDQHVNFWVFLQLFRSMRRKQDEENERRLMTVSEEAKFSSQEVSQFQEAEMKVSGRSKRTGGLSRAVASSQAPPWRPGLTEWVFCIFFSVCVGCVAAVISFKSALEAREFRRERPAFLELSSAAPSFGGTDDHGPGGVATPVEPVVVASGAQPGLLPKAVWRSKAPNVPAYVVSLAPSTSTPRKNCEVDLPNLAATLGKELHSVQDRRSLDLAVGAWKRLLEGHIQVEYMRQRLCSRMKAWLVALTKMSWTRPVQGGREITSALVWPQAAYLHFGVKRVWSLGEYTQWADLCAALATLGLEVTLWPFKGKKYPTASSYEPHRVVYTDYNGVHAGKGAGVLPPPDKTWLLDTFGTDGTVVHHDFFGRISPLTEYPLHRFLTLVPGYSSRNTFLGVAAVAQSSDRNSLPPRRWQCVLWSKVHPWLAESNGFPAYHWKLLREYTKYCKVIATVDSKDTYQTAELIRNCCPDVEIREVQSPKDFQELLLGSAVYVGVGEPLIAPSCFEALSLGTHVVQPRFPEPRQLKNKPITQNWTSQHPFLEQVPEPYAFTVDPLDFEALATTFRTLRHAFDSIYTEERPVSFTDKALREFYMSGEYPGREEFSISGFLKRVAGTVTKTRTLEAADWDWERGDHPQQLPFRAFKK